MATGEVQSHIPTEVYLDFLGGTIEIHWDYHAYLMAGIWFILVPISIITIRYFKPKPKPRGITGKIKFTNVSWWWFTFHQYGLYLAIALSLGGLAVALIVSKGFSGTVHSIFGISTIVFGCLEVVSAWLRGTHGGKYYANADLDDPSTWHGDHYGMTPRRQRFEAYHKTAGYLAGFFAFGAVASGLMRYPMPIFTNVLLVVVLVIFVACIVWEYKGRAYDTYLSCFGDEPDNPRNKIRKDL